ncbi:hypothetical protein QFC22_002758 [Naganishia vaughanmartiniae]|uniref:Uncharacterized protein n=1 Tax=Naganishia vaughanmartiniae TaxID=1424756 RepID=A0ACC2XBV4_9TREE|nr:hypothetical protein QFC22_002758 [Naganishia vaughanmartiniae]
MPPKPPPSSSAQQSISTYFAKPASPRPKRKHSPEAHAVGPSNATEPIELDDDSEFDEFDLQYIEEPAPKKAKSTPSKRKVSNTESSEPSHSAIRTVDSFFSRKGTDKDAGRDMRALAIQKAFESGGSGARRALKKYKLAEPVIPHRPPPSGAAFEDYQVLPATSRASVNDVNAGSTLEAQAASRGSSEENEAKESRRKRHAQWQNRLHGPTGLVPRRRSLNLDETEAREVRTALAEARGEVYVSDVEESADPADAGDDEEGNAVTAGLTKGGKAKSTKAAIGKTTKGRGKKKEDVGPSGLVYSPLEKQFMEIKAANPDVLLLMEVGYKYRFLGDDAKIASKELGIACFPSRNFYSASIPTHRLNIHVKKLVAQGYKVGVVRQMETAALKAVGENRNKPFERKMTNLYTSATYVDDSSIAEFSTSALTAGSSAQAATNAFVCLTESSAGGVGTDDRVKMSILGVIASTGEVLYDEFIDSHLRTELETRLAHLEPTEILIPGKALSRQTEKLVQSFAGVSRTSAHLKIRLERAEFAKGYDAAHDAVVEFYTKDESRQNQAGAITIDDSDDDFEMNPKELRGSALQVEKGQSTLLIPANLCIDILLGACLLLGNERVQLLDQLPKQLTIVLAASIKHLDRFGLADALLHIESFQQFSARAHMILSANCLESLEIFRNQTDHAEKGALLWVLDHCKTKGGRRMLREWLGRPLTTVEPLQQRLDAVREILKSPSVAIEKLKGLLRNQPDMQRGLSRIQYGKATPNEVATLLLAFKRIATEFENNIPLPKATMLAGIVASLPKIRKSVERLLSEIDVRQARSDAVENLFVNPDKFPSIQDAKDCMVATQHELNEHLKTVRKQVKQSSLDYITVAGVEHLIELRLRQTVPDDWIKISSTKYVARYHTPFIIAKAKEFEQAKETLHAAATTAFQEFQGEIALEYEGLRNVAVKLATFDCLLSFAVVAAGEGYCRPEFVPDSQVRIKGGRHPMAEVFNEDVVFVPNDISFDHDGLKVMIITGPNMAGKSTVVRATALICIMAQIGCYVPAESATLGLHDAIFTRMGASDELSKGQSTFMVELTETSQILREATSRSLVILDELGRGTSTHDGTAIAYGVLGNSDAAQNLSVLQNTDPGSFFSDRLANMGCNTMFITHFPTLCRDIVSKYPTICENFYMDFAEVEMKDGSKEIVFLYRLVPGLATRSFGVWVGKLAGIPQEVLARAQEKGDEMRLQQAKKVVEKMLAHCFGSCSISTSQEAVEILSRAKTLMQR